jgi:hypothetical protein
MENQNLMTILEWSFTFVSLVGAALLATYGKYASWGWVAFLAANLITIAFAVANNFYGMLLQQVVFTATSLLGIYRSGLGRKEALSSNAAFEDWWAKDGRTSCLPNVRKEAALLIWEGVTKTMPAKTPSPQDPSRNLIVRKVKAA